MSFLLPIPCLIQGCAVTEPVVECTQASVPSWAPQWPQPGDYSSAVGGASAWNVHGMPGAPSFLSPRHVKTLFTELETEGRQMILIKQDNPCSYPLTLNDFSEFSFCIISLTVKERQKGDTVGCCSKFIHLHFCVSELAQLPNCFF